MTKSVLHSDRSSNNVAFYLAAALLLVLPCLSQAREALEGRPHRPLTLHDCIAIALGESPALEASRFDVFSAAQEVRAAQGMLLPQVTGSARNRMGLVEHRVKLLGQSLSITQEQQKQGLKLPIDVKLAKEQFSAAQTLLQLLREQAVAGSLGLSKTLGLSSSPNLSLSNILPDPPDPPPTTEQLIGACLNHHPSLERQRALIDQAKQNYRLERFRLYPSVYLDGSATYIDDFSGVSNSDSVFIGAIAVSVPIFDFGAQLATTRSKLMKYKAEQARLFSTADDVNYEVLKIYQTIYTLTHNILGLQGDVAKAQRDVQVIQAQRQQGIAEPLIAIEKELHLIAKQDELHGIEARRLTLYARLQKAAGGAWKWIP